MRLQDLRVAGGIGLLAGVLAGCAPVPDVTELAGECGDVFGGSVCTWGQMEGDQVVAIGATIPMRTIEGAPPEMEMLWPPVPSGVLMLPEAVQQATGMSHMTLVWEPHGHPPGAYLTPHFDFHFYGITPAERDAIDCVDTSKPATLPAGYELPDVEIEGLGMLAGLCVPKMGMHSLLSSEMTATEIFNATMVVGYNRGSVIFTEPMVSRDFLLRKQGFTLPVPAVSAATGTRYPTTFEATFDAASQSYRMIFAGFSTAAN